MSKDALLEAETFKVKIGDESSDSWNPEADDDYYKDGSELLSYFASFKKVASESFSTIMTMIFF